MTSNLRDILLPVVTALLTCTPGPAQNPQIHPRNQIIPTVTFTLVDWKANPRQYSIAINSAGSTTYTSIPRSVEKTGAPYLAEFLTTAPVRQKVFDLAQHLSFFEKPLPGAVRGTAGQRSLKTLAYRYADAHHSFSYYRAENPAIRELTILFEKISATLEFGRRLEYLHLHEKEKLGPELRLMTWAAQSGRLLEVQAIGPTLQEIALDDAIAPAVRQRAKALLREYGSTAAPSQS